MKVLFAIGSAVTSERLANLYYQTYGEKLEYKDVFYFKAILEEVKRDKTYDRIVIAEELEPMQTNVVDAINQMLLNNLDSITDEIDDSPIIFICSQNRTKSDSFISRLFNMGIYNFLIGDDRQEGPLCKLIKNPRNKKEAKAYININPAELSLDDKQDDGVDERELISICNYFDRLKTPEEYISAFANVAEQYSDDDLSTIVAALTRNLKRGQDIFNTLKSHPTFSKYCAWQDRIAIENQEPDPTPKKPSLLNIFSKKKSKANDNEGFKNLVENRRKKENVMSHVVSEDEQRLDQEAQMRAQQKNQYGRNDVNPISDYQQTTINPVAAVVGGVATAFDNRAQQEELLKKQQEELIRRQQEELLKKQQEEMLKKQQEELVKKQQEELLRQQQEAQLKAQQEELIRKQQEEAALAQQEALLKAQQEELIKKQQEEILKKQQEEMLKKQQDELLRQQQEAQLKAQQEALLRAQQEAQLKAQQEAQRKAQEEQLRKQQEEQRARLEAENLRKQQEAQQEALRREALMREQEEQLRRQQEELARQRELAQQQMNSYATTPSQDSYNSYYNPAPDTSTINQIPTPIVASTPSGTQDNDDFASTITPQYVPSDYKKVVAFVGPSKAGTSFMANCIGTLLAMKGIKTTILDMTKSRGLYWFYSDETDKKYDIVASCMSNLSNGQSTPIQVGRSKNLSLYTTIPKGKEDNRKGYRHKTVMETARRNTNLLIIDCDFTTPSEYLEQAQEIYVVQDLDLVKVADTKEFFKDLKNRHTDWSKLRLIINNSVKCNVTAKKIRKNALTYYQDPSYTYTEEFETIKTCIEVPLDPQNYANYIDGMESGKLYFEKFTPEFQKVIEDLSTIVYGITTKKKGLFG
ncbi:MAG: hypothetical protein IKR04_02660 [Clostridia bacterium]|nr:hypothetical protein [Clostridia bacterium]